jgi:glycogen debranching enzyme
MDTREWLEADGLGGFASGTVATVRTRRYHGWLLSAPTGG